MSIIVYQSTSDRVSLQGNAFLDGGRSNRDPYSTHTLPRLLPPSHSLLSFSRCTFVPPTVASILSLCPPLLFSLNSSIHPSTIHLLIYLPIHPSIHPSVHPSIHPSIHP